VDRFYVFIMKWLKAQVFFHEIQTFRFHIKVTDNAEKLLCETGEGHQEKGANVQDQKGEKLQSYLIHNCRLLLPSSASVTHVPSIRAIVDLFDKIANL